MKRHCTSVKQRAVGKERCLLLYSTDRVRALACSVCPVCVPATGGARVSRMSRACPGSPGVFLPVG
jgi:hypothetical protein